MNTRFSVRGLLSLLALVVVGLWVQPALAQKVGRNCLADGGANCDAPIPDGSTGGLTPLTSTITLPGGTCASVSRVCVAVGIEHSARSDLSVQLSHGATTVPLALTGPDFAGADIYSGTVLEIEFDGQIGDGAWNLVVTDATNGEYGALNNWTLGLCCGDACGTGPVTVNPATGLVTSESGGAAQVSVELTCPPFHQVTIPGIASSDTTEGTTPTAALVFDQANATQPQTITVTGVDDPIIDGDIAYTLTLGVAAIGAPFSTPVLPADLYNPPSVYAANNPTDAALVNKDNDAGLTITDVTVSESAGTATFTVTLNAAAARGFTIDYATADDTATAGADYTATNGTLTFVGTAKQARTISVPILNDAVPEPTERFFVNLSNVSDAAVTFDAQGIGTITNSASALRLTATKAASGGFTPGTAVTYTVFITNAGAGLQQDNPGDEFTDVLPSSLTLQAVSATSGTALANLPANTVTWNGSLAADASVTLTITAQIGADAAIGATVSNQGQLSFDGDGDGANEGSGLTDDPRPPGATDPTDFVIVPLIPIPTLSVWGSLILGLLLTLGAWRWQWRMG
jgi:uncharacterized repeat protein (TIGR01451 family)